MDFLCHTSLTKSLLQISFPFILKLPNELATTIITSNIYKKARYNRKMIMKEKKDKLTIRREELIIEKHFNADSNYSRSKGEMVMKQRKDVIEVKSYEHLDSCCMQVSQC